MQAESQKDTQKALTESDHKGIQAADRTKGRRGDQKTGDDPETPVQIEKTCELQKARGSVRIPSGDLLPGQSGQRIATGTV